MSILLSLGFGHLSPPTRVTTQRARTHKSPPPRPTLARPGPAQHPAPQKKGGGKRHPPPCYQDGDCTHQKAHTPLSPVSLRVCARVSTLRAPHTPRLSPRARSSRAPHATQYGAGQRLSRPIQLHPARRGASAQAAHTPTTPTPEREHASKQAGAKGRTQPHCPTTPSKRANTKKAQTPQANTRKANTQPNHPPSKHAHNKPKLPPPARTQEAPTQ